MSGRIPAILASLALVGAPLAISARQAPATPAPAGAAQAPAAPGQPAPATAAAPARGRGAPPPVAVVGKTMAVVDLMTPEGMAVFNAQWKVSDVKIVEAPAYPKAPPTIKTTYDIEPHANVANFDDSSWQTIEPKGLGEFRGGGKVSFFWYRTWLTMPATVGTVKVEGRRAVLVITVDDYAEVWINGLMPRAVGLQSPQTVQGFNYPQRIPLGDVATTKPGDRMEIAIFGMNGPISLAPLNPVWFREAKVEFY